MFSPATMASSTTMPSAMMNANNEIMLIDTPMPGSSRKAPRKAVGMPAVTQNASLSSRNRLSATSTSNSPRAPFFSSRLRRSW